MNNSKRNRDNFSREFTESLRNILLNEKIEELNKKRGKSDVKR